jgi:hypothetical protein
LFIYTKCKVSQVEKWTIFLYMSLLNTVLTYVHTYKCSNHFMYWM